MDYGYKKRLDIGYEAAIAKTKEELSKEGFGVLTEIDVKETLKQKINVDFDKYIILGACSPPLAYEALKSERDIGLLMPCNIIIYEKEGKTFVSAVMPSVAMGMIDNEKLAEVAAEVEPKLKKVIDSI